MSRVLCVAAHPDDDAIGCGGSLAGHVEAGDTVRVLYVSHGERGIPEMRPEEAAKVRREEAGAAQACIGIHLISAWHEPDGALDREHLVPLLRDHLRDWPAKVVYTPHENDDHPDHRAVAAAVRRIFDTSHAFTLRQFEIWTPLAQPNRTTDITAYASLKRAAIRAHRSQEARNGFAEAILALNHYRGLMLGPGRMYAECFQEIHR